MTELDWERVAARVRIGRGTLARKTRPVRPATRQRMHDEEMMLREIRRCWDLMKPLNTVPNSYERIERNAARAEEHAAAITKMFGSKR